MKYDFDTVINRVGTCSAKWDGAEQFFKLKDVLPMWVADMDFKSPQPVIDAVRSVAERGIFGYATCPDSYYEALMAWMKKRHGWTFQQEAVVLTPGVVPALKLLIKTLVKPGEQVIVQTPVYYPFFSAIEDNGCEILDNPLRLAGGKYEMDLDDLKRKLTPKTKVMLLCSPHNPISRVWTWDELARLGQLCAEYEITVISDEIHSDLVYHGFKHYPFDGVMPQFMVKSVVCTAASKTFNLPGLRTSNIVISNKDIRDRFRKTMRDCAMSGPNMFGLVATEAAYRSGEEWLEQLLTYLEGNISFLQHFIKERIPGLKVIQPQGTYLLWLDLRECGIDPSRLGKFIREDARVGTEAGTMFRCPVEGFERMNIACPRSVLLQGLKQLEETVKRLRR